MLGSLFIFGHEEIQTRLTGDAEILRRTYFGELVLTAHQLAESQSRTIEPVKQRWIPGLHVETPVEKAIRIALARPEAANALRGQISRLDQIASALGGGLAEMDDADLEALATGVAKDVAVMSETLKGIADAADDRRPSDARQLVMGNAAPKSSVREVRRLARRLRARRIPVAVTASTVEADLRHALGLITKLRSLMTSPMIAVVGDAGRGKTQLAAELTSPSSNTQAGIFLRGPIFAPGVRLTSSPRACRV